MSLRYALRIHSGQSSWLHWGEAGHAGDPAISTPNDHTEDKNTKGRLGTDWSYLAFIPVESCWTCWIPVGWFRTNSSCRTRAKQLEIQSSKAIEIWAFPLGCWNLHFRRPLGRQLVWYSVQILKTFEDWPWQHPNFGWAEFLFRPWRFLKLPLVIRLNFASDARV